MDCVVRLSDVHCSAGLSRAMFFSFSLQVESLMYSNAQLVYNELWPLWTYGSFGHNVRCFPLRLLIYILLCVKRINQHFQSLLFLRLQLLFFILFLVERFCSCIHINYLFIPLLSFGHVPLKDVKVDINLRNSIWMAHKMIAQQLTSCK